jgi:BON domain
MLLLAGGWAGAGTSTIREAGHLLQNSFWQTRRTMSTAIASCEPLPPALADKVSSALSQNPYVSSRNLRFETSAGRVTLHGQVSSWYQKQMAQETLLRLDGVDGVENRLEVCWS